MNLRVFTLLAACALTSTSVLAQMHPLSPVREREERMMPQKRDFQRELSPTRFSDDNSQRDSMREYRERMSAEDRRQLRRDINDAGREIYRRPGSDRP